MSFGLTCEAKVNFFSKGKNKTENRQNVQKYKKGGIFTIFGEGTLMQLTRPLQYALAMPHFVCVFDFVFLFLFFVNISGRRIKKPLILNSLKQFLCERLFSFNLKGFHHSYVWSFLYS